MRIKTSKTGVFLKRTKCTKPRRLDSQRPVSGSPLARRGWPSGLKYGYARILRLSLSFSRLSTFVSHTHSPGPSPHRREFMRTRSVCRLRRLRSTPYLAILGELGHLSGLPIRPSDPYDRLAALSIS